MKEKTITLTESELQRIKSDSYREGMVSAMDRFNKQNNIYIKIGQAIEDLIYEKAESKKEYY